MDELAEWNDRMFERHPTPYFGLAGIVEKARLRAINKLAKITSSDDVLEIGCEAGNLMLALPQAARMVGFDISQKALDVAEESFLLAKRKAEFVFGNGEEPLPFEKGEFSVIICSEMLEHVVSPRLVLQNIHAIATPATRIILTVPYEKPKLVIKKVLTSTGIFKMILPGIEEGLSEWHLQEFSKAKLLESMDGLFRADYIKTLYGLHVVASVRTISD